MIDEADLEARGLYDPRAANAADRLALLRFLEAQALTIDDMVASLAAKRLLSGAGDRVLRPGEPKYLLAEAAGSAGVTPEFAERLRGAVGFAPIEPDQRAFSDADIAAFRIFAEGARMFGEGPILDFGRVLGSAVARVAESALTLFLSEIEHPFQRTGKGELAIARANLEATSMVNLLPALMETLLRRHIEAVARRAAQAREGERDRVTVRMAVGFVDLVGFTPRTQKLTAAELDDMMRDFEARAQDLVAAQRGRVVKLIGDEVMFVALDPISGCEIALGLIEQFRDDAAGVTPRGGLAFGTLLMRAGDYYGTTVNLASRIADLAVPFEILVTPEVAAHGTGFRFEPAGRRMLKGFPEPMQLLSAGR